MPDSSTPWSTFPPELWQRLLAVVFVEDDFDPEEIGLDAGLDAGQIETLKAWCKHVAFEDEVRRRAGEWAPSTLKFLESLKVGASAEDRAKIEDEIAEIREKAERSRK